MTGRPSGPGWITWSGLGLVLVAAAILSFSGLRDLAVQCRVPEALAPLFPVCLDAGLAVSTSMWLSRRANPQAERFAAWLTWTLLACTVLANAVHQGLAASEIAAPWPLAVAVGAVPPAVVGAVVHLAVLAGRQGDTGRPVTAVEPSTAGTEGAGTGRTPSAVVGHGPTTAGRNPGTAASQGWEPVPTPADEGSELVRTLSAGSTEGVPRSWVPPADHRGYSLVSTPAPGLSPVQVGPDAGPIPRGSSGVSEDDRAAALIAEGAGRRRLARELGVTEHQARELLAERRNGHEVTR